MNSSARTLPKPTSFGVYLGGFRYPLTPDDLRVLQYYDLLVVDPTQPGVLYVLADPSLHRPRHLVARLDLYQILSAQSMGRQTPLLQSMSRIVTAIDGVLAGPGGYRSPFTGVVIAGWQNLTSTAVLGVLATYLAKLGLNTYLEIVPPNFLEGDDQPDLSAFSGVIVRNGTIRPGGEVRDFFHMEKMKSTTREFVSQSCLRPFSVLMWETIDDRIELSHAVVKRSYQWCSYHGALVWIGSDASITNAAANVPVEEPLAAFQWLKDQRVMKIHEVYKKNRLVSVLSLDGKALRWQAYLETLRPFRGVRDARDVPAFDAIRPQPLGSRRLRA